jgi:hypothetical protein
MDGNMEKQFEVLADKIDAFGTKIWENWVPQKWAWQGLKTKIWQSLHYPLVACSFTNAQGDKLTTQLYKLFLLKLGVNCSFPKAYCHGPKCFQGLALPEFWENQKIQKIEWLLAHGNTKSLPGDLMGHL